MLSVTRLFDSGLIETKIVLPRIDATLCASARAKADELALQNDSMCSINHDAAALNAAGQGENLYCGFGDGCMTKTIAEHMEIGKLLIFKGS